MKSEITGHSGFIGEPSLDLRWSLFYACYLWSPMLPGLSIKETGAVGIIH